MSAVSKSPHLGEFQGRIPWNPMGPRGKLIRIVVAALSVALLGACASTPRTTVDVSSETARINAEVDRKKILPTTPWLVDEVPRHIRRKVFLKKLWARYPYANPRIVARECRAHRGACRYLRGYERLARESDNRGVELERRKRLAAVAPADREPASRLLAEFDPVSGGYTLVPYRQ